jgi:sugar O-acyltransferase (sialic acid O-acetyltransferase NeuD family)
MNRPLIIFGLGSLAREMHRAVTEEHGRQVAAFTVDRAYLAGERSAGKPAAACGDRPLVAFADEPPLAFEEKPLVAFEEVERLYPPDRYDLLVLIGYRRMRNRREMFARAKAKGYRLPNVIAPSARLAANAAMGENNVIGELVYVGDDVQLGDNVLIRPLTHIGHMTRIGSHSFIAPGTAIASACRIGELCYLGIGATVIEKVTLGDETLVAAGAVVTADAAPCTQLVGNPARPVGEHSATGIMILR